MNYVTSILYMYICLYVQHMTGGVHDVGIVQENRHTLSPVGTVSTTLALQGGDNPHMTSHDKR